MRKLGLPGRRGLLGPWDPFEEIRRTQERLSELFEEVSSETGMVRGQVMAPLVDVEEKDNNIVVTADIPGVDKKDIDINVRDDMLEINARCQRELETEEEGYVRKERSYSMFSRSVSLPAPVKEEGAKAKLENGVLKITLPKSEIEEEKKKIIVE
ncbi:heat shock protein Hsp20 [Methanosalsum zhilinae DSM 4017]|uniref:Heat shock protein Hsp20 n=1 Tax=Methanosalsum zhilinae (strain DSM 4017 / NBRC 107636 / OCM 62 / WeN5) TaxID=679901 RepID=F7XQA5_METZD|nr:Hsp20/alpha crystallin family protein [Methanosalsum zhilinae]AEH61567.1 heat shock protein Hsp20 [Methanosalsum zhilinae DSM 4017]